MVQSLADWVRHADKLLQLSEAEIIEYVQPRDPPRPLWQNPSCFYSACDGVILYQKVLEPNETFDVKGAQFGLAELFEGEPDAPTGPCWNIGIFMPYLIPHYNRVPLAGVIHHRRLDPVATENLPMVLAENELMADQFSRVFGFMNYERFNARMVSRVYSPVLDIAYWIVRIADDEVNSITDFCADQNGYVHQNVVFGNVRRGSQCNLVVELDDRYEFELCCSDMDVVQAGLDKLIEITPAKQP